METPPPNPPPGPPPAGPPVAVACYRHPDRLTRLSCTSCGQPICVDCTHQAAVGQKCAECAAPSGRSRVITAREVQGQGMLDGAPVTKAILFLTAGVAAVDFVAPAAWAQIFLNLAHIGAAVEAGEWWRGISSALLHDGLWHIGFNMWALAVFGPQIERRAGAVPYLLMYLGTAAVGGLLFQVVRPDGVAIGASGAIFGLFGAHVAAAFLARATRAGQAGLRQLMPLLVINLLLPLIIPRIAWEAHVGGLVAGALIMFAWTKVAPLSRVARPGETGVSPVLARGIVAGSVLVAALGALVVV